MSRVYVQRRMRHDAAAMMMLRAATLMPLATTMTPYYACRYATAPFSIFALASPPDAAPLRFDADYAAIDATSDYFAITLLLFAASD